ncbi:hypothetical protein ACYAFX_14810 [Rhodococcus aetherivorans]
MRQVLRAGPVSGVGLGPALVGVRGGDEPVPQLVERGGEGREVAVRTGHAPTVGARSFAGFAPG